MVSTTSKRLNHYEVLGLTPTASSDEIARAFASEISIFRPRSFGGIAEVTVAYETLRDPARRRAYDAALGLNAEPEPKHLLSSSGVGGASFLGRPGPFAEPEERSSVATPPPQTKSERIPFIAAALRELASPEPLREAAEVSSPQPQRPFEPLPKSVLTLDEGPDDAEEGSLPWKRIGFLAGGLILVVGLLGGWLGWMAGNGEVPRPERAAKVALPPPTTYSVDDPAQASAVRIVEPARAPRPKRPVLAASRVAHPRPTSRLASLDEQLAEPVAAQSDAQATEAAPVTAVAASLPLPNRVIARTIARIGYPCGEVASTTAGGAPGVFTVTCTSGHSYQAAPVRGRYHFRRLSAR